MWKNKLCLSVGNGIMTGEEITSEELIKMLKDAGFDGFFNEWSADNRKETAEYARLAREYNMIYQSIHAPFGGSFDMWSRDKKKSEPVLNELLLCLSDCKKYNVPLMIAHTFIGFTDDAESIENGLENFGILVKEAERLGVKIAFENTEGEEYLFMLMKEFENSEAVGFCWDTGHEMCYNHSQNLMKKFGKRLFGTHINDNLGISDYEGKIFWTDDLHLLPFDGVADWEYIEKNIADSGFCGPLTFELTRLSKPDRHENDIYLKMRLKEYLAEAYKRACRVATGIEKERLKLSNRE